MLSDKYKEKVPCDKCGEPCYKICYINDRVICQDCFTKVCETLDKISKEKAREKESKKTA